MMLGRDPSSGGALLPPQWDSANPGWTRPCRKEEGQGKRWATPDIFGVRAKLQDRKTRAPPLLVGARRTPSPHPARPPLGWQDRQTRWPGEGGSGGRCACHAPGSRGAGTAEPQDCYVSLPSSVFWAGSASSPWQVLC